MGEGFGRSGQTTPAYSWPRHVWPAAPNITTCNCRRNNARSDDGASAIGRLRKNEQNTVVPQGQTGNFAGATSETIVQSQNTRFEGPSYTSETDFYITYEAVFMFFQFGPFVACFFLLCLAFCLSAGPPALTFKTLCSPPSHCGYCSWKSSLGLSFLFCLLWTCQASHSASLN